MKHSFTNNFILPGCFLFLLFYLFFFPAQAFLAACNGLDLWFHTILPSLLPFCVLSNILIVSGIIPKLLKPFQPIFQILLGTSPYGTYTLVLGFLCGYPMGAKIVGDLYRQQKISQQEGNYLLMISNHASPMFLTTYIALHIFDNKISLSKTFFILYCSAFATSLFLRLWFHFFANSSTKCNTYSTTQGISTTETQLSATSTSEITHSITIETVDNAIFNGFEIITKLGGYIILFSICSSMLQQICEPFPTLQWFLPGITELTTGIYQIAQSNFNFNTMYILILAFTSFGGICTIAQTKGMLYSTPFQISTYIIGKIINALFTFVLAILFFFF